MPMAAAVAVLQAQQARRWLHLVKASLPLQVHQQVQVQVQVH
jgi:hypothetical protein